MKKCFSLLLTLAMLLSMVPAVGAAGTAQTESETAAEENIAAEAEKRHAKIDAVLGTDEPPVLDESFDMPETDALNASATSEYTINITLEFSSKAEQDTNINVSLYQNSYYGNDYYQQYQLKKGKDSLDISFSAEKGSYLLEFYSNVSRYGWLYADVFGGLSQDWENHLYIGAFGDDTTIDLTLDGDLLLEKSESTVTGASVEVSVNLPAKVTEETYLRTFLQSATGTSTQTASEWLSAGKDSYTESFTTTYSSFIVGYYNATNCESTYTGRYAADVRYIAEDGGITTQASKAKVFNLSETTKVTIDEPDCFALTGTISLESALDHNKALYAFAEFEDGECYGSRAYIAAGAKSVNYTIYVPESQKGNTFQHWAAETLNNNSNRILDTSYLEGESYTLSKSAKLGDITLPDPPVTVAGTFSLPEGMTAPAGGLTVEIEAEDTSKTYTLAAGKRSFDFELTPPIDENTTYYVYAYIMDAPDNLCDEIYIRAKGSDLLDLELNARETVIVSGNLSVPADCKDLGSTIRIDTSTSFDDDNRFSNDIYVTVLPGHTTASYELKAIKGYESNFYAEVDNDATGKLLTVEQHLQEDFTVGENWSEIVLTKSLSGVDFTYERGKTISGKITLADGLDAAYFSGTVYAYPTAGGDSYNNSFYFDGEEGTYSVAVPFDYTGTYRVYFSVYSNESPDALTGTSIYYSTSGMTTSSSNATPVVVPEDGAEVDLVILKAKIVTGSLSLAEGLPADGQFSGSVYAFPDTDPNNSAYRGYFDFGDGRTTYSIKLPVEATSCKLALYLYTPSEPIDGLVTGTYLYLAEDGSMVTNKSAAKSFSVTDSGLSQNLVIPMGNSVNITLNAPDGFSGVYSGRAYLYNLTNNQTSGSKEFSFDGTSGTLSFTAPVDSDGYTIRLYLNEGPGSLTGRYYYYDGSTGKWVSDSFSASGIDLSSGAVSISLPKAKLVSGKLVSSQGDKIKIGENSASFYLYPQSGSSLSCSYTIDENGNFTIAIPDTTTGSYRLQCYPYSKSGTNVLRDSYYYKSDATSSVYDYISSDSSYYITIGESDVTGLTIYVDTGYVLSGKIKLADDVTISGRDGNSTLGDVNVYLQQQDDPESYDEYYGSISIGLNATDREYSYSIAVPKTSGIVYDFGVGSTYLYSNTTSNLYTGAIDMGDVTATGNGTLDTITLVTEKATIAANISLPETTSSASIQLHVVTAQGTYVNNTSVDDSPEVVTVSIPSSDTSSTYQIYYFCNYGSGLVRGTNYYVAADGTLTSDASQAGSFTFDKTSHSFSLVEVPPYLTGKIYLPGYTGQTFYINVSAASYTSINVSADKVKTDAEGNKYVNYVLSNSDVEVGETYRLQAAADYSSSTSVSDMLWDTNWHYINEDGSYSAWRDATIYTVPESYAATKDFTLRTWDSGSEDLVLQGDHGITAPTSNPTTYTVSYPGATSLKVTFSDRTDVSVILTGNSAQTVYYPSGGTYTVNTSETNGTMTVSYADYKGYYKDVYYGFGITKIVPTYSSGTSGVTGVVSVYTENGSTDAIVMKDLLAGETVRVSLAGPDGSSGTLVSAIYDSNGKMLEMTMDSITFTNTSAAASLDFVSVEGAATLKLMLLTPNTWAPQMAAKTITG